MSLQPGSHAGSRSQLSADSNKLAPPGGNQLVPNGMEMKQLTGSSKVSFDRSSQRTGATKNKIVPVIEVEVC